MEAILKDIADRYVLLLQEYLKKQKEQQIQRTIHWPEELPVPYWSEELLRPILNLIKAQIPDWECFDKELTPMGLYSRVTVFFFQSQKRKSDKRERRYIYIVFRPANLFIGQLFYETIKNSERHASDSLGLLKGWYRQAKRLESIQEAVDFLKAQTPGILCG